MIKAVICLALTASLLIWFQNCGEQLNQDPADPGVDSQDKVVVAVGKADYVEVNYQPRPGLSDESLTLDLENQTLAVTDSSGNKTSCDIPNSVQAELEALLTDVQICEPAPLEPDQFACMAIGVRDIELRDADSKSEWLQPTICNSGRFLCNGGDTELRQILADVSCE